MKDPPQIPTPEQVEAYRAAQEALAAGPDSPFGQFPPPQSLQSLFLSLAGLFLFPVSFYWVVAQLMGLPLRLAHFSFSRDAILLGIVGALLLFGSCVVVTWFFERIPSMKFVPDYINLRDDWSMGHLPFPGMLAYFVVTALLLELLLRGFLQPTFGPLLPIILQVMLCVMPPMHKWPRRATWGLTLAVFPYALILACLGQLQPDNLVAPTMAAGLTAAAIAIHNHRDQQKRYLAGPRFATPITASS